MSVFSIEIMLIHFFFFFSSISPNTIPLREVLSKHSLEEKRKQSLNELKSRVQMQRLRV